MEVNSDLTDLLRELNAENAEYLIVGGYAVALHGYLRATKDVDLFVGTDAQNAQRVWNALAKFGAPLDELSPSDLSKPDVFFIIGYPPNRIDVITTIDGISFEQAWKNRIETTYGDERAWFIGKADLISNKTASGRPQDIADVASLKEEGGA